MHIWIPYGTHMGVPYVWYPYGSHIYYGFAILASTSPLAGLCNGLCLNPEKTEAVVLGTISRQRAGQQIDTLDTVGYVES